MTYPHSTRPDSGLCSRCLGAPVRVVEQRGDALYVDGVLKRTVAAGDDDRARFYARKGGRR